jgi:hypothetical protein
LLTHCQATHLSMSKRKVVLNMVLTSVEVFYSVSSFRVNKQALFGCASFFCDRAKK